MCPVRCHRCRKVCQTAIRAAAEDSRSRARRQRLLPRCQCGADEEGDGRGDQAPLQSGGAVGDPADDDGADDLAQREYRRVGADAGRPGLRWQVMPHEGRG